MSHPFDALNPQSLRTHKLSAKWHAFDEDVLPLWIADMDFPVSPAITEALHKRLESSLGYSLTNKALIEALLAKMHTAGFEALQAGHIGFLPGVVQGLYAACLGLAGPGEEVITMTPIYPPFLSAISDYGRIVRHNPLIQGQAGYEIDFEQLESLITPATRLLMLCNPHNPTGRVWRHDELERLAELVLRHRLWVVSDELHNDLVLDGKYVPFASLSAELSDRVVTLLGPCKTFNTAGLGIGAACSTNISLIKRLFQATKGVMAHANSLSQTMWLAGLEHGGPWLADVLGYLRQNRETLSTFLRERLPKVVYTPPQGTYLAWLDFRAYGFGRELNPLLREKGRVALNDGSMFGPDSEGFVRINFATSKAILLEALERIERTVLSNIAENVEIS